MVEGGDWCRESGSAVGEEECCGGRESGAVVG